MQLRRKKIAFDHQNIMSSSVISESSFDENSPIRIFQKQENNENDNSMSVDQENKQEKQEIISQIVPCKDCEIFKKRYEEEKSALFLYQKMSVDTSSITSIMHSRFINFIGKLNNDESKIQQVKGSLRGIANSIYEADSYFSDLHFEPKHRREMYDEYILSQVKLYQTNVIDKDFLKILLDLYKKKLEKDFESILISISQ